MKWNVFKSIVATATFLLVANHSVTPTLHAQSPPSTQVPATLPRTVVGKIAENFLAAINSGSIEKADAFVTNHLATELWQQMTPEKYRSLLRKIQEQSGDLKVDRIFMADDRNLRVLVASAKAKAKVGLEIVLDQKGERAVLLWIHHFPPQKGPAPFPSGTLDEQAQAKAIEHYLDEAFELGHHSGAVLVAKGDQVLLDKAWGYAHRGTKTPNTTEMQYGTASVGKMFTAVAIAQLYQAGKLEYTDTIAKFFPDYPNKEAASRVQIQHLLAHTGGLGDPFDSPKLANRKNYQTQSEWFETFADKPLAFEPGARHEYSNGGFIVLSAIVEKITGQRFTDYLKEHVFAPAGMDSTGLTTASRRLPVSVPHAVTVLEDPLGVHGPQPKEDKKEGEDGVGMGGWTSTTMDLFRFARAVRTNKLLSESNTVDITTGKVSFIPAPMNVKYCFGFYEMPVGKDRMIGHSGGGGDSGVGAEVEMLWDSGYTIVLLSNHGLEPARRVTHTIARFLAGQSDLRQAARN